MTILKNAHTTDIELRELARQHAPAAIAVLIEIAKNTSAPTTARVTAAKVLKRRLVLSHVHGLGIA